MPTKKAKRAYHSGQMPDLVQTIATTFEIDPARIWGLLRHTYPEFHDKTRCPNCLASMAVYVLSIDSLTARLILDMGNVVQKKIRQGISFHDANKVHVQTDIPSSYAIKSRTTQAAKLGLVTKVVTTLKTGRKVHDIKAGWLITKRGYDFLRGIPVPKSVRVFRNRIKDHEHETITLSDAFNNTLRQGEYAKEDWFEIESYVQGRIF